MLINLKICLIKVKIVQKFYKLQNKFKKLNDNIFHIYKHNFDDRLKKFNCLLNNLINSANSVLIMH